MSSYVEVLKIAVLFFPFIALLISAPFILIQYHKFGSISFLKSLILYSFVLYLICAYFLVILPLPKISRVSALTTPRMQLIPFKFVMDFVEHTSFNIHNIHTYLGVLKESYFFVPIFNIVLTLPFGIYLRYYFKCGVLKTLFLTFLLSLFFELTQLSGLYFIYPRGYRLFDVDDLFLNTLGGLIGYLVGIPFTKILPSRDDINKKALERGKIISGFRRTTALCLDFILIMFIVLPVAFLGAPEYIVLTVILCYMFVLPLILKGCTLSQKFLNISVTDSTDNYKWYRLIFRKLLVIIIYFVLPYLIVKIMGEFHDNTNLEILLKVSMLGLIFIFYLVSTFKYIFTNKKMLYEKLSKTKLVSTLK